MIAFIPLFVVAAALATVNGLETLNVSSSSQDYMHIAQRELIHEIEIVDVEIAAVNSRYADRLDVIQYQQQQLLLDIQQVNRTLKPLQALNLVRKYCIQTYDSQLITYGSANSQLKACYNTAASLQSTLTSYPRSSVSTARSIAGAQLNQKANSCDTSYSNYNQTLLESCYINIVNEATSDVNYYLNSARVQLEKSLYDASLSSNTAVQCSFKVEKTTLETISQTMKLIDDCELSLNAPTKNKSIQNLLIDKLQEIKL